MERMKAELLVEAIEKASELSGMGRYTALLVYFGSVDCLTLSVSKKGEYKIIDSSDDIESISDVLFEYISRSEYLNEVEAIDDSKEAHASLGRES